MLNSIPENSWSQVKSEIQRTWSGLDSSALEKTEGDVSEICRLVSDKMGLSKQEAERKLSDIVERCSSSSAGNTNTNTMPEDQRVSRSEETNQSQRGSQFQANSNPSTGSMSPQ